MEGRFRARADEQGERAERGDDGQHDVGPGPVQPGVRQEVPAVRRSEHHRDVERIEANATIDAGSARPWATAIRTNNETSELSFVDKVR